MRAQEGEQLQHSSSLKFPSWGNTGYWVCMFAENVGVEEVNVGSWSYNSNHKGLPGNNGGQFDLKKWKENRQVIRSYPAVMSKGIKRMIHPHFFFASRIFCEHTYLHPVEALSRDTAREKLFPRISLENTFDSSLPFITLYFQLGITQKTKCSHNVNIRSRTHATYTHRVYLKEKSVEYFVGIRVQLSTLFLTLNWSIVEPKKHVSF